VNRIDFQRVARAALARAPALVPDLLPNGRRDGLEWVALNPTRADGSPGSFKVNLATGRWADFATGDAGGDLVALFAYVEGRSQRAAALALAERLGVDPWA
jgi:hypothetical protein